MTNQLFNVDDLIEPPSLQNYGYRQIKWAKKLEDTDYFQKYKETSNTLLEKNRGNPQNVHK